MESLAGAPSLLNYLDAPVVVADPDGNVVFLNPAFELLCATTLERAGGKALAALFEGGDREAVLGALAATCARGQSVRFRIRHADMGFQALASPIAVDGQRVGAVMLLVEEPLETEGLARVQRELRRSVEHLEECVEQLAQSDAALNAEERHDWAEGARQALADARRASVNLDRLVAGEVTQRSQQAVVDPARVLRDAVAGVAFEVADCGVRVDVLTAPDLPLVRGDRKRLQEALETLLRSRLALLSGEGGLTLAVRRGDAGSGSSVVFALTEPAAGRGPSSGAPAPPGVRQAVEALGGTLEAETRGAERVTLLHLPAA